VSFMSTAAVCVGAAPPLPSAEGGCIENTCMACIQVIDLSRVVASVPCGRVSAALRTRVSRAVSAATPPSTRTRFEREVGRRGRWWVIGRGVAACAFTSVDEGCDAV
jgi:hypothetical protein